MPELGKHTLTRYLGSDCTRQLKLLLSPESGGAASERLANGMPLKQNPLPGLRNITDAGDEWAASRLAELDTFIGPQVLVGTRRNSTRTTGIEFTATDLTPAVLTAASVGTYLAEHQFEVGPAFEAAFDFTAAIAAAAATGQSRPVLQHLRPDLIEIRPPGLHDKSIDHEGKVHTSASDTRIHLRVIDIKLTSQPGPGYFAEIVYYSVALAGWLADHHLDADFAVSADPAIWPGTHEASALRLAVDTATNNGTPLSASEAIAAVEDDLVPAPIAVFVSALRHFFHSTLPEVISTPWTDLPFHVSQKCRGCDFLGDNPHSDPALVANNHMYCMNEAEQTEHLSRIPFISRGARELLTQAGTTTVSAVAATPVTSPLFGQHHSLRAQRTVISARAASVAPGAATPGGLVNRAGTSGMLPKWADLNIYVTADFDSSSAITLALGVTGFYSNPADRSDTRAWVQNKVFVVDQRSHAREEAVLVQFLEQIDEMVQHAHTRDTARGATPSRSSQMQIYLWDDLTYKHLCRVVSRHLPAILATRKGMRSLAWLFPAEELLPNERLVAKPVVSIVSDAVRALVTLPVPHHYSLLETARNYHPAGMNPQYAGFRMPRYFDVPFSDQIPSERAHDIWNRGPNFARVMGDLQRAVSVKLDALDQVTRRLRTDLQGNLRREAAHVAYLGAPSRQPNMTADELLLYSFARLDAAVSDQEVLRNRAMPAHEREAKFASMRLSHRLNPTNTANAWVALGLAPNPAQVIYAVRPESTQAKFKDGDFLCAIVPESETEILDYTVHGFVSRHGAPPGSPGHGDYRTRMSDVLGVTIVRFDRELRLVVLELETWAGRTATRDALIHAGYLSLGANVSIEKVSKDFFTAKLQDTLSTIGKTPKAAIAQAGVVGQTASTALGATHRVNNKPRVPVEDVLWDAAVMAQQQVSRMTGGARAVLQAHNRELNATQWSAFDHALTHRLSVVWGPPGTGKSRTVVNIVAGAAWDAEQAQRSLRVLVCANTYTAIDNVLRPVADVCAQVAPSAVVYRARSQSRAASLPAPVIDLEVNERYAQPDQVALQDRLMTSTGITVVGSVPQQIYRLTKSATSSSVAPLFDLILIDEAGQMDTANAVLALATLAEDGCVVVAGDPLQLPPIHQVEPPAGAESLVGSIYNYVAERNAVPSQDLLINYRSNAEIVTLAHDADYPAGLVAHSPALRIGLATPLPVGQAAAPVGWPATLAWSPTLADLLDPNEPVTCVVYRDGLSGQANPFEAQVVAGLTWLLDGRVTATLTGLLDPAGNPAPAGNIANSSAELLATGLGVVTPHRAQQSEVVSAVHRALPHLASEQLRDAVDTVERFQGQERDVIIASYAVGDPDTIGEEDEFLLMLNRFNVMVSRARAKLIVLVSEEVLRHLPHDLDVLWDSRMLKSFADIRCRHRRTVDLAYIDENGNRANKQVSLRTT